MDHDRIWRRLWFHSGIFLSFVSCAIAANVTQQGAAELSLPRPPAAGEAVWLQVHAGVLPPGAEIAVATSDGMLLGTVSPVDVPRGRKAGTYTIALPKTAVVNGHVRLRLEIDEPGRSARPPNTREVESVDLIYVPISE